MDNWIVQKKFKGDLKINSPLLIEGLPGIGNVGKIAVDFLISELKPKLLYKIHSYDFSHTVYLTENNQIELPCAEIYLCRKKGRDILLLAGDEQPLDKKAAYIFADKILD